MSTLQDQFMDTLKQGQAAVVDGLKSLSDSVEAVVPSSVPDLPGLAFARRILTAQFEFASSVLSTVGDLAAKAVPTPEV
jgi:hypothetical protein